MIVVAEALAWGSRVADGGCISRIFHRDADGVIWCSYFFKPLAEEQSIAMVVTDDANTTFVFYKNGPLPKIFHTEKVEGNVMGWPWSESGLGGK